MMLEEEAKATLPIEEKSNLLRHDFYSIIIQLKTEKNILNA